MALVAVLSARSAADPGTGGPARRGELAFAGQTVVEYQARQTYVAGANSITILIDEVSPILTGLIDRLGADAIHATLVRDLPAVSRLVGAEDEILLLADGYILPTAEVRALVNATEPSLLVLPATPMTQAFERIDADHMWAGGLRARATTLHAIVDMLGDWDLPLTLMRRTVQDGAQRLACEVGSVLDGHLAIINSPAAAVAATTALAFGNTAPGPVSGDLDDWPVGRPTALLAPLVVRYEVSAVAVRAGAIGVAVLGLVALVDGLPTLGLLLGFCAMVGDRIATQLDRLLRLTTKAGPAEYAVRLLALATILGAGLLSGGNNPLAATGAALVVGLLVLIALVRARGQAGAAPSASILAPGTVLLILALGSLVGMLGTACAICALLAFTSHAYQLMSA